MNKLIDKAEKTNSKIWKWVLGIVISLILTFTLWWLKRRYDELQRLRVEKKLVEERRKDMELQTVNEKDANMAKAFREEAEKLVTRAAEYDTEIKYMESQTAIAKEAVDNAKNWKELEDQARGK